MHARERGREAREARGHGGRREAIHARNRGREAERLQELMLCIQNKMQIRKYRLDRGSLAHAGKNNARQQ